MGKVAVIGVHGVADQKPGETAKAVARILQAESSVVDTAYEGFVEERLHLPVTKLVLGTPPSNRDIPARAVEARGLSERSPYLRMLHRRDPNVGEARANTRAAAKDRADQVDEDAGIEFMFDQVHFYNPRHSTTPDRMNETYETLRLRGTKVRSANRNAPVEEFANGTSPETETESIDIYEFYWADLSRLASGVLNILVAVYQLLFHVCSLGRDTLDLAEPECRSAGWIRRWQWWVMRWCHAILTACLSLFIPILNLCLLGVMFIVFPAKIPAEIQLPAAAAGAALVGISGGFITRLYREGLPHRLAGRWGMLIALSLLAVCAFVFTDGLLAALFGAGSWNDVGWMKLLVVEWGLLSSAAMGAVLNAYSSRKPQIWLASLFFWLPNAAVVAWLVSLASPTESGLAQAAMRSSVILILQLHVCWAVMAVAMLVAGLMTCGSWLQRGTGTKIHRAMSTGFVSMIAPVTLFAFVTLAIYSPMMKLAELSIFKLPEGKLDLIIFGKSIPGLENAKLEEAINWMFELSVTRLSDGILLVWGAAAFLVVCNFFWSVWAESTRPPSSREPDRSRFIGESLSNAFGSLGYTFGILFCAFPFVFLIGSGFDWFLWAHEEQTKSIKGIFPILGGLVFGLVATGKLGVVLDKVWPALDVILDVDNYLQGRPWDRNPKARIATRYVALLRYIASQGYDRVVIVAHSQGTVITVDLLRFLRVFPDPKLAALGFSRRYDGIEPHDFPITLLTMGCPLRQLYGWRFPHLYHWARHDGVDCDSELRPASNSHLIGDNCRPDPRQIGVKQWINAYNSGDYVGRHLWRDDNLARPAHNADILFTPWAATQTNESQDGMGLRRELCFGAGAHTHYFEDNAVDIARLLNDLI